MAAKEVYKLSISIGVNGDKEVTNKIKKVEESTEKAKKKLKDLGSQKANPTAKLNDKMTSALDKIESKTKKLANKNINATANIKDNATAGINKVKNATEKLNNKKTKVTVDAKDDATPKVDKVKNATDKLGNKKTKVKIEAEDKASTVIEKANSKLSSWLKSGAKKVVSVALAGSLAMGGFGAETALKTFSDFEYGMKTVQATSQASEAELQKLTQTAKDLGATTSFSAKHIWSVIKKFIA